MMFGMMVNERESATPAHYSCTWLILKERIEQEYSIINLPSSDAEKTLASGSTGISE